MDILMGVPLLIGAITGVVELIKRAVNFEWRACLVILSAAATGYLLAPHVGADITNLQGMVLGFGASGFVTFAQNIGKNSPHIENG
jgi:hypothetical protein